MPLSDNLHFSHPSAARQALVWLCKSLSYGHIQDLLARDHEPVLSDPHCLVLVEVKLDSEERPRQERAQSDFALCSEISRLMVLVDRIQNGKISKLEIRAGIPRRVIFENPLSELPASRRRGDDVRHLSAARQAGSKDPVRRWVVERDGSRGGCGPPSGTGGEGGVRKNS
jgi:hypothetical protein